METPSSARRQLLRQSADSNKIQLRKEVSLSKYYGIAKRLLDHFTAAFDGRSLDEAYIYGIRFISLSIQSIPRHPSFSDKSYAMHHREMKSKCDHVLECLEIVRQRMDAEEILREQCHKQELKKILEREREMEASRLKQKEETEQKEATNTQMSALAKLSAMQRDINRTIAKPTITKTRTEKIEVVPVKDTSKEAKAAYLIQPLADDFAPSNTKPTTTKRRIEKKEGRVTKDASKQPKRSNLVRAQVDFTESDTAVMQSSIAKTRTEKIEVAPAKDAVKEVKAANLIRPHADDFAPSNTKSTTTKTRIKNKEGRATKDTSKQRKKSNLVRAHVDFTESGTAVMESSELNEADTSNSTTSTFVASTMLRMASIVSRKPKSKEPTVEPIKSTDHKPDTLETDAQSGPKTQSVEHAKSQLPVEKQQKLGTGNALGVKQVKKAAKKKATTSAVNKQPTPKVVAKPKLASTSADKVKVSASRRDEKQLTQKEKDKKKPKKQTAISGMKNVQQRPTPKIVANPKSTKKEKNEPAENQKGVSKPKLVPTTAVSVERAKISASEQREKAPFENQKPNLAPASERKNVQIIGSSQETMPNEDEVDSIKELPAQRQRRPEENTIVLLEASIVAQVKRIEEIEQKLIPKLLNQARKEHEIAKIPKISKQERLLHKRKAIHCVSQKRKWVKLAETSKVAVFRMETQIFRLENAMEDQQVVEAIAEAKTVIKAIGNSSGINDIVGFSEMVGAGKLMQSSASVVEGEEDEIMMEELESWIGSTSDDSDNKATENLNDDEMSILSLPKVPQHNQFKAVPSKKQKDGGIAKKLLQAIM